METERLLTELIKCAVFEEKPNQTSFSALTAEDWMNVCDLATRHNLGHIVGEAVTKYDLVADTEFRKKLSQKVFTAMQRYYCLENEFSNIKRVFETEKISYLPLKGAVMRNYYPKPWLRTSCDLDILVHEEDLERAAEALTGQGYSFKPKGTHDIGGESPCGIHVELHYTLIEEKIISNADKVAANIWDYAVPSEDGTYRYTMSDEMFYFYHIAHMAKHFEHGGCGVRPFIDLFILKKTGHTGDGADTEKLLCAGGLNKFAEKAEKLSCVWFEGEEHDGTTQAMENFLLDSGAYGTVKNCIVIKRTTGGSSLHYILSRLWMPYKTLIIRYPSLRGHRCLFMFYEIRRWIELLFNGRLHGCINEVLVSNSITDRQISQTDALLKNLGLL